MFISGARRPVNMTEWPLLRNTRSFALTLIISGILQQSHHTAGKAAGVRRSAHCCFLSFFCGISAACPFWQMHCTQPFFPYI